ncbi:hypothetical protein [Massilia sp. CF038]|uniref:hypothetical protein n=1 Tax=Massilia sp. CF038 TaxID=1881045 RepID=UPI00091187A8|nr:hypothetical protein [Massilia sp. CF038]SHG35627.1 hypothetical protein SAMN05428948_0054 [Massilia sp. CF038]
MLIGLLALIGASGLLLGLARSMYRPWLGRTAFCIALAALALGFAVLIWGGSGQDVGPLELGFAVVMVLAMGLSVWGALMSFLAVKGG